MTYDELFDCILNAKDIVNLKKGMKEFILAYLAMGHDESFVAVLSDDLKEKKDSPIHYLLYSFLNSPESFVDLDFEMFGFEVECDSWKRINKKDSYQLTKTDFLNYLDFFENRYQLRSSIEGHYEINIVEMGLKPRRVTSTCIIKGNVLNILLPRCENATDKETALSLVLSQTIMEVLSRRLNGYRINKILESFIPKINEYNSMIFSGILKEVIITTSGVEQSKKTTKKDSEKKEVLRTISTELKIPNEEYVDVEW